MVFYRGRPPRGIKMDWNMQEYRLPEATMLTSKRKGCMKLDDWVLCQVRQKNSTRNSLEDQFGSRYEPVCEEPCSTSTNAKLEMVRDFLYRDCLVLPLIIGSSMDTVSRISFEASKTSTSDCEDNSDTSYSQYSVPPFDSSINGQKRKQPTEGTQYENFIQPKKKVTDRDGQWSDDRTESNLCITNQSEGNNFNTNQWNSIIQYQEFNYLDFAEGE
ncbi:NAC transcription factor 29 [Camellia lanceoleosa]|uniref:NAC transcription factor 29 n=1 Tax=Camellia lanceoleosa TaxID=1840588 RepID=A0ACC0GDF7_9ERIC|nr:NAC transcription factor 29 [Camellia lanceoleosa]